MAKTYKDLQATQEDRVRRIRRGKKVIIREKERRGQRRENLEEVEEEDWEDYVLALSS